MDQGGPKRYGSGSRSATLVVVSSVVSSVVPSQCGFGTPPLNIDTQVLSDQDLCSTKVMFKNSF
jgi:hypothetical protein